MKKLCALFLMAGAVFFTLTGAADASNYFEGYDYGFVLEIHEGSSHTVLFDLDNDLLGIPNLENISGFDLGFGVVPEPSSLALIFCGAMGLFSAYRRKKS